MKISELFTSLATISPQDDRVITNISADSRNVHEGSCFFALRGYQLNGCDFIDSAIANGASAIVIDTDTHCDRSVTVPIIQIPDLHAKLGEIAARFYANPSDDLITIGVTGTNGKTSVSQYIATALKMSATSCGIIGTLGYGFPGNLMPSNHTTSEALTLQSQLAFLHHEGAQAVAMEVSSHALEQQRVGGITFDFAVFTNLTRDHLDFHGTMENYAAAKRKLFFTPGLKHAIINTDDAFGLSLAKELQGKLPVYTYGLQTSELSLPSVTAHQIHLNSKGVTAKILSPWGEGQLHSRLMGRFNVSNLLAVLTTLLVLEVPFHTALDYLAELRTVPGRMQVFGGGKLPLVVVDYAHTPDALMQVLLALREHTHGTLWCVFGCGGDRDRGKRALMGQVAERYSDQLLITDDNPRTENPGRIVADIKEGLLCPWAAEIEHDRGAAIAHVISCAQPGDVVLVAGKGHEAFQIYGTEKIPFIDAEHIQEQLKLRNK